MCVCVCVMHAYDSHHQVSIIRVYTGYQESNQKSKNSNLTLIKVNHNTFAPNDDTSNNRAKNQVIIA